MGQDDEADTAIQDFIEGLEQDARKLGLYMSRASAGSANEAFAHAAGRPEADGRRFVYADFDIGDLAFSDEVQHPENHTDDAVLSHIESATIEAEAERIMRMFTETGALYERDEE